MENVNQLQHVKMVNHTHKSIYFFQYDYLKISFQYKVPKKYSEIRNEKSNTYNWFTGFIN
jgi:hypothetical protein